MKRLFHITSGHVSDDAILLCELSQHHISIARADVASKQLQHLSYYELRSPLEPHKLMDVLAAEGLSVKNGERLVLSNAFQEVVLVPADYFTEEKARLYYTTTYGSGNDVLFFNELKGRNLVLVHAIPESIVGSLKSSPGVDTVHIYSCQLYEDGDKTSDDRMTVHFTGKEIRLIVIKEQQLKLVQTYRYAAPMDVVYYLLTMCQEFNLSQSGTTLVLSGLVSEDSAMYKELYQYFSDISFWEPGKVPVLKSEYPPHFFSTMYNLAACVL